VFDNIPTPKLLTEELKKKCGETSYNKLLKLVDDALKHSVLEVAIF